MITYAEVMHLWYGSKSKEVMEKEISRMLDEIEALRLDNKRLRGLLNLLSDPPAQAKPEPKRFTVGDVITARSIGDSACEFNIRVESRNGNTLTVWNFDDNKTKRCKVKTDQDGNEFVMAMGTYSMAPVFRAK